MYLSTAASRAEIRIAQLPERKRLIATRKRRARQNMLIAAGVALVAMAGVLATLQTAAG